MAKSIDSLIKSELSIILQEQKYQPFTAAQTPGDQWPVSKKSKPWPDSAAENLLIRMKASKYNEGRNDLGYSDYPVYIRNYYGETLWFYENGEVTSWMKGNGRNLFYSVDSTNPIIYIFADSGKSNKVGYYRLNGSSWVFQDSKKQKEKKTEPKQVGPTTKDTVRKWLDFAGWVPFIGDAADLINAIWYFYDYSQTNKTNDLISGILSSLAIIPVVGSGLAAAGKTSMKYMKIGSRIEKAFPELFEKAIRAYNPTKAQLDDIAAGFSKVVDSFSSIRTKLADKFPDLGKTLDQVEHALDNSVSKLKELRAVSKQGADVSSATAKKIRGVDAPISGTGVLNKQLRKLTSLTYQREIAKQTASTLVGKYISRPISSVTQFLANRVKVSIDPRRLAAIREQLENSFIKGLYNDPDKCLVVLKTMGKNEADIFKSELDDIIRSTMNSAHKNLDIKNIRKYGSYIKSPQTKKLVPLKDLNDAQLASWLKITNASDITSASFANARASRLMSVLKNVKETDPATFQKISKRIANNAIENDNPVWNAILQDPIGKFKSLFPNSASSFFKHLSGSLMDYRKSLDLIWNEIQEAGNATALADKFPGIFGDDGIDKQAILVPFLKDALQDNALYKGAKSVIGKKGMLDTATSEFDLPSEQGGMYDPNVTKK